MMSILKRPLQEADGLVEITRDLLHNADILNTTEVNAIQRLNRVQGGLTVDLATIDKALSAVKFETMDLKQLNGMVEDIHHKMESVRHEYKNILELMKRNEEVIGKRAWVPLPTPAAGTKVSSTAVESTESDELEKESDFIAGSFTELRQKIKEHTEPPLFTPITGAEKTDVPFITKMDNIHPPERRKGELSPRVPETSDDRPSSVIKRTASHDNKVNTDVSAISGKAEDISKGSTIAMDGSRGPFTESFPKKGHATAKTLPVVQGAAGALGLLAGSVRMGFTGVEKEIIRHTDGRKGPEQISGKGGERVKSGPSLGSRTPGASPPMGAVSMLGTAAAVTMLHSTVVPPIEIGTPEVIPQFATKTPASEISIPNLESGSVAENSGVTESSGLVFYHEKGTMVQSGKMKGSADESVLKAVKEKSSMAQIPLRDNEKTIFPAAVSGPDTTESPGDKIVKKLMAEPGNEAKEKSGKKDGIPDEPEMPPPIQPVPQMAGEMPVTLAALLPKDVAKYGLGMIGKGYRDGLLKELALEGGESTISHEIATGSESEITKSAAGIGRIASATDVTIKSYGTAPDGYREAPVTTLSMLSNATASTFGLGMGIKNDTVDSIPGEQISFRESLKVSSQSTVIPEKEIVSLNVPKKAEIPETLLSNTLGIMTSATAFARKLPSIDERSGERTFVEQGGTKLRPAPPGSREKRSLGKVPSSEPVKESPPRVPETDGDRHNKLLSPRGAPNATSSIPSAYGPQSVPDDNNTIPLGVLEPMDYGSIKPLPTAESLLVEAANEITENKSISLLIDKSEAEALNPPLETGALELLKMVGRKTKPAPMGESAAPKPISHIPVSTPFILDPASELTETGRGIRSFGPKEIRMMKSNVPAVRSTEQRSVPIMLPTLEGPLFEPLSTIRILNFFSMEHEKLTGAVEKSEDKGRFTDGSREIGKALKMVVPVVQDMKERAADEYLRNINFNPDADLAVTRVGPVTEKKGYRTTVKDITPGSSLRSNHPGWIDSVIGQAYSPPKVQPFSRDFTNDESDIALNKSLEELRKLKLRDLDIRKSKEEEMKARERAGKTEPVKREIAGKSDPLGSPNFQAGPVVPAFSSDIDKAKLYEVIEKMLEEEAKRHGLVFR